MKGPNDSSGLFDSIFGTGKPVKWYHCLIHSGHYIPYWIEFFFSGPFKGKKKDLDILGTVQSLPESETTDGNIKKSGEPIRLHRIAGNTKAGRGPGKRSLRAIAAYLFIVPCIVSASHVPIPAAGPYFGTGIPNPIMITVLSAATVNIIGLGLIVLRGRFLANDKSNEANENHGRKIHIVSLPHVRPSTIAGMPDARMFILNWDSKAVIPKFHRLFCVRAVSGFGHPDVWPYEKGTDWKGIEERNSGQRHVRSYPEE